MDFTFQHYTHTQDFISIQESQRSELAVNLLIWDFFLQLRFLEGDVPRSWYFPAIWPARERWMVQKERKWMENKTPEHKNLQKREVCKVIQECRFAGTWVFMYPYTHVFTSNIVFSANSMNSRPGYKMPSTWLSHVDLETFSSFMLHFLCHCFYWNLVPNLLLIRFSSCVYWQYIYFKCSIWSQTTWPSTWTATGLWGCDLLSQSLPSSPSQTSF